MLIVLTNVDENRVHTTTGPQVRFDIDDQGLSGVRVVLTIDETTHIVYPAKGGKAVVSKRTLAPGLHACAVMAVAHDVDGGRTYDWALKINGQQVASSSGTLAAGKDDESAFKLFQLQVE